MKIRKFNENYQDSDQIAIDNMSFSVRAVKGEVHVSNDEELKFEVTMDNGDVIKVDSVLTASPNPADSMGDRTIVSINDDYRKEYKRNDLEKMGHTYEVAVHCYKEYKGLL